MSIQVYSGFSGQRYILDPSILNTLEALRSWIAKHAAIQPRNQILLTAQGKQVRTQTLLTENELFVFDSSLLGRSAPSTTPVLVESPVKNGSDDRPTPNHLADQNDIKCWQELFLARKSWAALLQNDCSIHARSIERFVQEHSIIERSLGVAVASLQQHLKNAEQKYANIEVWAKDSIREHKAMVDDWEHHIETLASIPARSEFSRFLQPNDQALSRRQSLQTHAITLQTFVDVAATRKSAASAESFSADFAGQIDRMRECLAGVNKDGLELTSVVEELAGRSTTKSISEAEQLLEEVRVVFHKMTGDANTVQAFPQSPQALTQALKMDALHVRSYLPNLSETYAEMCDVLSQTIDERNTAATLVLKHMHTLSDVEARLSNLFQDFKKLDLPNDEHQVFAPLSMVVRLPAVYGQLLVESVRRREWVAKMKRDCSTLQEEVATYHEEEEKRRKKWMRTIDDVVDPDLLQSDTLGIELSLRNEGGSWPMVTREELSVYRGMLVAVYGHGLMSEQMDQAIRDLDKPTRKQVKNAKAFKNGSMYDAAFGDTSLFLRGDEQHKTLREANLRLEEELKGQQSRVRKLEDLLHRQSQTSRSGVVDMFSLRIATPTSIDAPDPRTPQSSEDVPRVTSQRGRRQSLTQLNEEKRLARRVVDLEAQIHTLQQEAINRKNSDAEVQKQVQEAVSTKRDLLDNMDAQQREFASERRALETELKEAREKVEEIESELDKLLDSHDGERTTLHEKLGCLEEEIARLKDDATGHAARAANEHDAHVVAEKKLVQATTLEARTRAELANSRLENDRLRESEARHLRMLLDVYALLKSEDDMPTAMADVITVLEEAARRLLDRVTDLNDNVELLKHDNLSLTSVNEKHRTDLARHAITFTELEQQIRNGQERLAAETAKSVSLQLRVSEGQVQLKEIQDQFAEGETGSEVLKQRLVEQEARTTQLVSELAEAKSNLQSANAELSRLVLGQENSQEAVSTSNDRLSARAERAKEVSQRLYAQNSRLERLLERLGFVVHRVDGTMVVERASKLATSTTITESQSLNRTISGMSAPLGQPSNSSETTSSLATLQWTDAVSADNERVQFDEFIKQISQFNIDTFSDAIVKRLRDFEYTARKYSKEAKEAVKRADGYKDRSSRLQREAHAKLAVRDFKEGDLALFLPTRGQAKGAWAAFNIGFPHYFLAEKEGMRLSSRDFIVGRITKIEERVVNMRKSLNVRADAESVDGVHAFPPVEDDNPFDLSDGLTWWMVHANEERGSGGAPSTPGLAKSTVAAANVDAKGSIRIKRSSKGDDASKHLNKSLESRRSSSASKRSVAGVVISSLAPGHAGAALSPGSPGQAEHSSMVAFRPGSETPQRPSPLATGGLGIVDATVVEDATFNDAISPGDTKLQEQYSPAEEGLVPVAEPMTSSVRSLQRHLATAARKASRSPAKSPMRNVRSSDTTGRGASGWERLGEYSIESSLKNSRS